MFEKPLQFRLRERIVGRRNARWATLQFLLVFNLKYIFLNSFSCPFLVLGADLRNSRGPDVHPLERLCTLD